MLFSYAVHLQAWPLVLGQGLPLPIYARNIWMIYRDQARTARNPLNLLGFLPNTRPLPQGPLAVYLPLSLAWTGGRVVEGARLESV